MHRRLAIVVALLTAALLFAGSIALAGSGTTHAKNVRAKPTHVKKQITRGHDCPFRFRANANADV